MTSNVGMQTIRKQNVLGFATSDEDLARSEYEKNEENVMEELRRTFRPEFLNRIDDIIVFHSLDKEHISKIVDLMLADLRKRLEDLDITLEISDPAKVFIADEGFDSEFGARPLKRAIQKMVEDRISEELLKGTVKAGSEVLVDLSDNELVIKPKVGSK